MTPTQVRNRPQTRRGASGAWHACARALPTLHGLCLPPPLLAGSRVGRCQWRSERREPVVAANRLCSRGAGLPSAVPYSPPAALPVPRGLRHAAPLIFGFPRDSAAIALATAPAAAGRFHRRAQVRGGGSPQPREEGEGWPAAALLPERGCNTLTIGCSNRSELCPACHREHAHKPAMLPHAPHQPSSHHGYSARRLALPASAGLATRSLLSQCCSVPCSLRAAAPSPQRAHVAARPCSSECTGRRGAE